MKMFINRIILCAITLSGCVCEYNEDCDNSYKNKSKKISEIRKNIDQDSYDIPIIRTSPYMAPIGIPMSLYKEKDKEKCRLICVDNNNFSRSCEFDF